MITLDKIRVVSMSDKALFEKLRSLASKAKNGIIQDCPPVLYACEVCGAHQCSNEEWLNCKQRLAAAKFIQSGDTTALTELKELREARDRKPLCKVSPPNQVTTSDTTTGNQASGVAT